MNYKRLPVIILNEGNLDFIFDMLNNGEYKVSFGEKPGIDNTRAKEVMRRSLEDAVKTLAICYIEIDSQRKRYVQLTRWFNDSKENRNFIYDINRPFNKRRYLEKTKK
jgi:hypothetical protein